MTLGMRKLAFALDYDPECNLVADNPRYLL
jgi:hypothetical protein